MKSLYLSILIIVLGSLTLSAQVTAENDSTVNYYIQNLFLGEGVTISNITINGESGEAIHDQVGSFQNNDGYLPVSSGVVLSTGAVAGVNFDDENVIFGEMTSIETNSGMSTDSDLEALADATVNDIVIIEFDFVPAMEYLVYDYAFGSEEYPEFVNSFNDAFGFFIAGPGFEGDFSAPTEYPMGSANVATLPNTSTGVTINNVNNGNYNCPSAAPGPCINCEYYIDNCPIAEEALDGMTTSLMVIETVVPGETYHIKLALGDALDTAFDSAVILKQGSFRTMASPPNPTSIDEAEVAEMHLAINPMNDYLVMQDIPGHISQYSLMDMQGKTALENSKIMDSNVICDVSELESGLYLLILNDEAGNIWTQKLVKE